MSLEDYSLYTEAETPFKNIKDAIEDRPSVFIESADKPLDGMKNYFGEDTIQHELADNVKSIVTEFSKDGKTIMFVHLPTTENDQFRKNALSRNGKYPSSRL